MSIFMSRRFISSSFAAAVICLHPPTAAISQTSVALDLDDVNASSSTSRAGSAMSTRSSWDGARMLPMALATAVAEARRLAAQDSTALVAGPDGVVDLSLSSVIDLTLRENLDIRVQSYQPAISAEAVRVREAIFDPLLSFTLSLFSTTNPTSATLDGADVLTQDRQAWNAAVSRLTPWGGTASIQFNNTRAESNSVFASLNPSYDSTMSLRHVQPLLRNFGRDMTQREIRVARNNQRSTEEGFRQQVIASVTAAIDSYWNLYGQIQNLEVRREALRLSQDLLRINRTRVEVGTMAPLEVASAEAEVARNEELLITAEHELRNAGDAVLRLINAPVDSSLWNASLRPVDLPSIEDEEIDVEAAIARAIENRPDVRQLKIRIENEGLNVMLAASELKPNLNLTTTYGLAGLGGTQIVRSAFGDDVVEQTLPGGYTDALDGLTSFDFKNWTIAATFELPLFNQAAKANHASAVLNERLQEDTLAALTQSVAVEIRRLARTAQTNVKRTEAAQVTRRLQEKRLDAEQKKFEHGLSTNFEVSQAQQAVTEARTNEILAITSYRRSLAALESATGTVLENHGIAIETK